MKSMALTINSNRKGLRGNSTNYNLVNFQNIGTYHKK